MDIRKIKKLVEILEESDLAEIEIHENDESVRLSRHSQNPPPAMHYAAHMPYPAPPPGAGQAPATSGSQSAGEKNEGSKSDEEELEEGTVIRAPMVGTFYAAPNPESDPYVRVGQTIKAGDVVCMIEAMKMFNQIESDVDGKVVAVLVDNAQPVEFDQPLFIVR